jgi:hypothetical protein
LGFLMWRCICAVTFINGKDDKYFAVAQKKLLLYCHRCSLSIVGLQPSVS